jgi:hypothetical protein
VMRVAGASELILTSLGPRPEALHGAMQVGAHAFSALGLSRVITVLGMA